MNTICFLLAVVVFDPSVLAKNSGVAAVDQVLSGDKLIIHVLDYHIVEKSLFGKCNGFEGEKLETEYAQLIKDASAVHAAHLKILAGVKEVFTEGLTDENFSIYRAKVRSITAYHRELKQFSPDDGDVAKKILEEHRMELLRLGAETEHLLDGTGIVVRPAEGPEYEAARPVDGKLDEKLQLAREEAIVKRIVKSGKTAWLVLGGGHDLTEIIRKHGDWGYVRVKPKGYPDQPGE